MGVQGLGNAWLIAYKLSFLVLIPSMVFCFLKAPELISRVYGYEYVPVATLFRIFLLFYVPIRFLGGGGNLVVLLAAERQNVTLFARAAAGVLCVALYLSLIPSLGAEGAVMAVGSAITVAVAIEFVYTRRTVRFPYPTLFSVKVFAASAPASVVCFFSDSRWLPAILISFGVFFLVYGALILVLKPLNAYDAQVLSRVFPRVVAFLQKRSYVFTKD